MERVLQKLYLRNQICRTIIHFLFIPFRETARYFPDICDTLESSLEKELMKFITEAKMSSICYSIICY